jgi:hypothetical protein
VPIGEALPAQTGKVSHASRDQRGEKPADVIGKAVEVNSDGEIGE